MAGSPRPLWIAALINPSALRRPDDTPRLPEPPPWLIPLTTAALLAGLAPVVPAASLAPVLAFALWAPALAWVDTDVHRLPDVLTRPATIAVTAAAIVSSTYVPDRWEHLARAIAGAGLGAAIMFGLAVVAGVGLGDVKLAIPLIASAAWHSWPTAFWAFLAGWAINAAIVLVALSAGHRPSHSPLGPPLVLGWICTVSLAALLNL